MRRYPVDTRPDFWSPELSAVQLGDMQLRAPIIDNYVQINNMRGNFRFASLIVSRYENSMTVRREDDALLQVEINELELPFLNEFGRERLVQKQVFFPKLSTATFIRRNPTTKPDLWRLKEQPDHPRIERLQKFADVLGSHVLAKQLDLQKS